MVDVETFKRTAVDGIVVAVGVGVQDRLTSKYLNPVLKQFGKYAGILTGYITGVAINYLGSYLGQEEYARLAAAGAFGFALYKGLFGILDPPEEAPIITGEQPEQKPMITTETGVIS